MNQLTVIPLLAFLARSVSNLICDHYAPTGVVEQCDRCRGLVAEVQSLITCGLSHSHGWSVSEWALANARIVVAAALRLVDLIDVDAPVMNAVNARRLARRTLTDAQDLLDEPNYPKQHNVDREADACADLDQALFREHGNTPDMVLIGHMLKAAGKAGTAAARALDAAWSVPGNGMDVQNAKDVEGLAGASLGAALDGGRVLVTTSSSAGIMAVGLAAAAAFDRIGGEHDRTYQEELMAGFEEHQAAEVADEAIGDLSSALADLERAEHILNAVVEEHRAVEQCVRTSREDGANAGLVTEYYQNCCIVCRDAKGRPVPSPCRTLQIVQAYGEEV